MGIVLVTISGDSKKHFANQLHEKTNGGVRLVLIQKRPRLPFFARVKALHKGKGFRGFFRQGWFGLLLRLDKKAQRALEYFRESSLFSQSNLSLVPKVMEVDSVNSDEVHKILKDLSPSLIVIWGSTVLEPRILKTAKKVINLHMGVAPHYRGALANQHAVLRKDLSSIGATIHYAEEIPDTGKILAVIKADSKKPPKELFKELNDAAREKYLEIATRLYAGEELLSIEQYLSKGQVLMFKHWTPEKRYKLAKYILEWESKHKQKHHR